MTRLSVGGRLLPAAAESFELWRALAADSGHTLTITSASDAFRPYETQERTFLERYTTTHLPHRPVKVWNGRTYFLKTDQATAAVPGTSNHGKGLAIDVRNAGPFTGPFYRWMATTGPSLGWSNTEGRSINEPWHWVNDGRARSAVGGAADATSTTTSEEDNMPSTEEIVAGLLNAGHPEFAGRTLGQFLGQIRIELNTSRDHLQGVIQGATRSTATAIVDAVLNTPIPRGGTVEGRTSLAGLIAWHDDGTQRLLDGQAVGGDVAPDVIRTAVTASVEAALAGLTITQKD
ncbi:M15 family metallopeptidase [Sanguibacter sp. 25GB23B1]|uniref:M15 family metallopeptidase n=1 Tax=unclassified Sanguibacter TaxID=2645534 RepID=UPI0032AF1286